MEAVAGGIADDMAGWIVQHVGQAAAGLAAIIARLDQAGADMTAITAAVHAELPAREEWAARTALAVASHTVHAVEHAVAVDLAGPDGIAAAAWRTHPAEGAHQEADGQVQPAGQGSPYRVDGTLLRWPGDLEAFGQTGGCRCRLSWLIVPART
jgi:hypothetical protein